MIDDEGRPTDTTTKYLKRIYKDLETTTEIGEGFGFPSFVQLPLDKDMGKDFIQVDMSELKARFLANAIAESPTAGRGEAERESEEEKPWRCEEDEGDGQCQARFRTRQALLLHQRSHHGVHYRINLLVLTNVCIF